MYCIVRDSECQYFIIPCDKKIEWEEYVLATDLYFDLTINRSTMKCPDQPSWAVMVSNISNISFPSFKIT